MPPAQGAGLGERLLRSLADGLPHRTMVLSTPEGENRAWRLYRRLGFLDLARNHLFPGDHRPFGVLGRPAAVPAGAGARRPRAPPRRLTSGKAAPFDTAPADQQGSGRALVSSAEVRLAHTSRVARDRFRV